VIDLDLPTGYTYRVYLEIMESHKAIMRGTGTITLKGTGSTGANPFMHSDFDTAYSWKNGGNGEGERGAPGAIAGKEMLSVAPSNGVAVVFTVFIITLAVAVPGWLVTRYMRRRGRGSTEPRPPQRYDGPGYQVPVGGQKPGEGRSGGWNGGGSGTE